MLRVDPHRLSAALATVALTLTLGACGNSGSGPTLAPEAPPAGTPAVAPARNLVLISIDTLRADRLGCYGYQRDTTPHIDALAAGALLFSDATAAASNTAPSHMSMFTGLRPPVHGVFNVGVRKGEKETPTLLSPAMTTLAEYLHAAGFATAALTDGGYLTKEMQFDRGYDRFERRPERVDAKVDAALASLAAADRSRRQFLFVHTYEVHAPYVPPVEHDLFTDPAYAGPLREKLQTLRDSGRRIGPQLASEFLPRADQISPDDLRFLSDLYDGGVHFVDAELGRLLDVLTSPPWSDDTAVILLSDHGEAFLEHGGVSHAELHSNVTHVPLIVRAPGLPPGRRDEPVAGVDVLPTALALVGLPVPSVCDGVSLLDPPPRDRLIASYNDNPDTGGGVTLRRGGLQLLRNWSVMPWALYDVAADPGQQRPLPADRREAQALAALAEKLAAEQQRLAALLGRGEAQGELSAETLEQLEALGYIGKDG